MVRNSLPVSPELDAGLIRNNHRHSPGLERAAVHKDLSRNMAEGSGLTFPAILPHLVDVGTLNINCLQPVRVHVVPVSQFEDCLDLVDDPQCAPGCPLPDVPSMEPALLVYRPQSSLLIFEVALQEIKVILAADC